MKMLEAVIVFFVLQKIAVVVFVLALLGFLWCRRRWLNRKGTERENAFCDWSNRRYICLFFLGYSIPLLLMSAAGYVIYGFFHLKDPLILAGLTFVFGILNAVRKVNDHTEELWNQLRKLA